MKVNGRGGNLTPRHRPATVITRSTQPCIPPGSLNRVPASAGGKGGNVTSAGWHVTLCDPIWHVSSRSGVATLRTAIHLLLTYLLTQSNSAVQRHQSPERPILRQISSQPRVSQDPAKTGHHERSSSKLCARPPRGRLQFSAGGLKMAWL